MPTKLSSNTIRYCSDEFTAQTWMIHNAFALCCAKIKSSLLPNSDAKTRANSSGLLCLSDTSHSNWSTKLTLPTWIFNWREEEASVMKEKWRTTDFDRDALIAVILEKVIVMRFELLLDCLCNGRDKGHRVQVQIIAQNFSEHFRRDQLF